VPSDARRFKLWSSQIPKNPSSSPCVADKLKAMVSP
jgi:hypothetical protein